MSVGPSRETRANHPAKDILEKLQQWREWFPVPQPSWRLRIDRWILLEGNRLAVTVVLLAFVFATVMLAGTVWTFRMQRLLTETPAVQTILNTLLSEIILLVSIVVSINSIVLSYDITPLPDQEERIEALVKFRQKVGRLTESETSPTDPASFLDVMAEIIHECSEALVETADRSDEEVVQAIEKHVDSIAETTERLRDPERGAEFGVIWLGLDVDCGPQMDRAQELEASYGNSLSDDFGTQLDELTEALELFATGREYFKTLYYTEEVSQLSRTLLLVSLPTILVTASTILAINAELLPEVWILGMPRY